MNLLFPKYKSKYITIIRNPIDHFESVFNYFDLFDSLGLGNYRNPLQSFLRNPTDFNDLNLRGTLHLIRNPLIFDLGLDYKYFQNKSAVVQFIKHIDEEFDLVLITEYFDESLMLLKDLLCWKFEDILYIKQKVRKQRTSSSREVRTNILSWNQADVLLYNHFNRTLWRKILRVGPKFYSDLQFFRKMNRMIEETCSRELSKKMSPQTRACRQMRRPPSDYLAYTKEKMKEKLKDVDEPVDEDYKSKENSWDMAQELKYEPVPTQSS